MSQRSSSASAFLRRLPQRASERGVTLWLVILILGFALAASLGASALVLGEVKQTRIISDSVTAFFAADAGAEQALYQLCRQNDKSDQNNQTVGSAQYSYAVGRGGGALQVVSTGSFRNSRRAVEVSGFTENAGVVDCGQAGTGGSGSLPIASSQWKMDETSGTNVTDSLGSNDGTATGATIASGFTGAASDKSRSFASGNYVSLDTLTIPPASLTISAWVYPTARADGQYIFGRLTPSSYGNGMFYIYDSSLSQIGWTCDNDSNNRSFFGSNNTRLPQNQWSFVTVVAPACNRPADGKIYVNGVDVTMPSAVLLSGSPSFQSLPSFIGVMHSSQAVTTYFRGKIDEVNLYGSALSGTQVCDLFKAASGNTVCGVPMPVARWKMDETSGSTVADSVDSNNGTANGTTIVAGISGNARRFSVAADKIEFGDVLNAELLGAYSISTWVKTSSSVFGRIIDKTPATAPNELYSWANSPAGKVTFGVSASSVNSNQSVNDGSWHHAVFVRDTSTGNLKIYIDGVLDNTAAETAAPGTNSSPLTIGNAAYTIGQQFPGDIDELTIYTTALTAGQICDLYKATSGLASCGASPSSQVALWKMNELSGSTVADSADSHNGTASGTTIVSGISGNARSFDGVNDYVDTGYTFTAYSAGISHSLWIKTTTGTGSYLVANGGGSSTFFGADFFMESGHPNVYITNGGAGFSCISTAIINDGVWHHIAFTWDGTTNPNGVKIYVDGILVKQCTSTNSAPTTSSGAYILGQSFQKNNTGPLAGELDEVAIYNAALTAAQICDNYKAFSGGAACGTPPSPGRIALWKMESSGATIIDSADSHDGTANGTTPVIGISGNARSFNGSSDFITVGDASSFKFLHGALDPNNFKSTISAWVKINNPGSNSLQEIISTGSSRSDQVGIDLMYDNRPSISRRKRLGYFISNGVGGNWTNDVITGDNAYPNDSNWHHVAVTYDQSLGNKATIYVDGVSVSDTEDVRGAPSTANSQYPLHIGSDGGEVAGRFFDGSIDEVGIYNTTLTATQVCDLYKTQSGRASCP